MWIRAWHLSGLNISELDRWAYLERLRANWESLESDLKKALFLILATATTFELASRALVTQASFFGVQVNNVQLIWIPLPLAYAYFLYEMLSAWALLTETIALHDSLMGYWYPAVYDEDLHLHVGPHNLALIEDLRWRRFPGGRSDKVLLLLTRFRALLVFALSGAFAVYSLVAVMTRGSDWYELRVATLVGTLLLLVPWLAYVWNFVLAVKRGRFKVTPA